MSELHEQRMEAVLNIIQQSTVSSLLDLGCGDGELLELLARNTDCAKLVGIDVDGDAIRSARERLASEHPNITVYKRSFLQHDPTLGEVEALVMLETIEHIAPQELSRLEGIIFKRYRPRVVVITTPNADYNGVLGLIPSEKRRSDHHFEWSRMKFRRWVEGVATRNGYTATTQPIGPQHPSLGSPSQLACLRIMSDSIRVPLL